MHKLTLAFQTAAQTPTTAEERSTQFVPVQGGTETTSAEALLVAAYLLMWALLIGFVYLSWRRQKALESRVDGLEAAITKASARK